MLCLSVISMMFVKILLRLALRNAEINYFSDQLDLHKDNWSNSWTVLNTIIGKNSNKSTQRLSLYVYDNTITDSMDIANECNNFFVSIGPLLTEKITSTKKTLSYVDSNTIVIFNVSCAEVEHAISTLKNSSAGWDEIPTSMAKKCITGFIEPLTYLINKLFAEGIFPTELKLARVVRPNVLNKLQTNLS